MLYRTEIFSTHSAKLWFFFKKNWDISNPKFQRNSIAYYFFLILLAFFEFCFLFHISKLGRKLWNILWCFIRTIRDFTSDFWKILKVLLKKILICEIFFISQFCILLFVFLFFYYFWHLFSISSTCTCQKILETFRFFYFIH